MTGTDIVEATDETLDGSGWRVAKHQLTVDRERETARRMLADLRGYRDALLFDRARRELGEPAGGQR